MFESVVCVSVREREWGGYVCVSVKEREWGGFVRESKEGECV